MAHTHKNFDNRNEVRHTERRGGNWNGRRGGLPRNTRNLRVLRRHQLLDGTGREDHYGIKMHEPTVDCDICCRKSDLFAVGPCLHPICMECGIRLRILGKNEYCPNCRTHVDEMKFVHYTGDWSPDVVNIKESFPHKDASRYKLIFENEYAANCFDSYLAHVCPICKKKGELRKFQTFASLNQHVYMVHRFFYCDICVEHLDLLSHERRVYSQADLERHLEKGDVDDMSQKGHPQCLFCEKRFLDEEYRYKHLRKEHFFCQICDADGNSNYFYNDHSELVRHYKEKHVVCEEGECKQLGIAFPSEVELKLHKSTEHAAGRQTLNLDFYYDRGSFSGNTRGNNRRGAPIRRNLPRVGVVPMEIAERQRTTDPDAFTIVPSMQTRGVDVSLRYSLAPAFSIQNNDFPRLGSGLKQDGKKTEKVKKKENALSSNEGTKQDGDKLQNNATTSWFIDDDESFGSASLSAITQPKPGSSSVAGLSVKREPEDSQDQKLSYITAFRRPTSLSNLAAKLRNDCVPDLDASDAFPSLNSSDTAVKNLPANSVWKHNKLQFSEKSQIVDCIVSKRPDQRQGSSVFSKDSTSKHLRKLPEPDIWPQQSVPSSWEERLNIEGDEEQTKLISANSLIVRSEAPSKKRQGRKEKTKSQRQKEQTTLSIEDLKGLELTNSNLLAKEDGIDNQISKELAREGNEDVRNTADASAAPQDVSPDISLSLKEQAGATNVTEIPSHLLTEINPSVNTETSAKTSSVFAGVVSSTFNSILNGISRLASSNTEAPISVTPSEGNVANPTLEFSLPPPPGMISMLPPGLSPPPGLGPPPGFETPNS